jgi:hypothetical protein
LAICGITLRWRRNTFDGRVTGPHSIDRGVMMSFGEDQAHPGLRRVWPQGMGRAATVRNLHPMLN